MKNINKAITKEQPSKMPRFLRRRQEPMDRITLGECLHLHYVLGWTAEILAGHLMSLGGAPAEGVERLMGAATPLAAGEAYKPVLTPGA